MTGGWAFVQAAYGVAYGGLALYGLGLLRRVRSLLAADSPSSPQSSARMPQDK